MRLRWVLGSVDQQMTNNLWVTTRQYFLHHETIKTEARNVFLIFIVSCINTHFALVAKQTQHLMQNLVDHDPFQFDFRLLRLWSWCILILLLAWFLHIS